jgi:hypothetical protein
MSKKSTPTNLPKPRKVAAGPNRWPAEYEDVDHMWARDAIFHGNGAILARYLREADEIDPRIRRELGEMLDPKSNHNWRLEARYRFRGKPENRAKRWRLLSAKSLCPLRGCFLERIRLTPKASKHLPKCSIRNRAMHCGSTLSSGKVADRVLNLSRIIGRSLCLLP